MNQIVTSSRLSLPAPAHPKLVAALSRMSNALEPEGNAFALPATAAPTDDQRAFMERRVSEISRCMAPVPTEAALAELTAMLRVMALKNGDVDELEAVIRVYLGDVEDLPLFAVVSACRAFRRGEAGNGRFAPTPGELRLKAKTYIQPWVEERAKLSRILNARVLASTTPQSEDRREAVLAHARKTVEVLKAAAARHLPQAETYRPPTIREAQEWLDRYEAAPPPLPKLSDAGRRTLGIAPQPARQDAAE